MKDSTERRDEKNPFSSSSSDTYVLRLSIINGSNQKIMKHMIHLIEPIAILGKES